MSDREEQYVDWNKIDSLLVLGEITYANRSPVFGWPTVRDIEARGYASKSAIGRWSQSHNVRKRRAEAREKYTSEQLIALAKSSGRVYAETLEGRAVLRKLDGTHSPPVLPPLVPTPTGRTPIDALPTEEIERVFVHGEPVLDEETGILSLKYPSQEDLVTRYNCSHFAIRRILEKGGCRERREEAMRKVREQTDIDMIKLHVDSQLTARTKVIALVDKFITKFGEKLEADKIKFEPTDFDKLVRLREFLSGSADTRTENVVTLQAVQNARGKMDKSTKALPADLSGVIDV